jgi:hypothetical protein
MLTTWIPLLDIPVRIGGLAVQPGGHLGPPRPPRPLSASEPRWATTSYEPALLNEPGRTAARSSGRARADRDYS